MDKLSDDVKIVEYEPKYAKGIADMWNKSIKGWNGNRGDVISTENQILEERSQSSDLKLFLAVLNDDVLGYCSFAEYHMDENTLFIPTLNVRDDFHGKGVGKKLVLRAVKESVDMKWPRLDLFTWPGNTKAIPLYKKTGFFWEEKDNTTHLMNFIPTVLNTEATKEYFNFFDWYEDSKRVIEIAPDGIKDNDTHYFEYLWEKDNKKLRIEFEKLGRGLCCIETDDYYVKSYLKKQKLIFGREYVIYYDIQNKSGKELNIKISGENDKNINYSIDKSFSVKDSTLIEGVFAVGKTDEEIESFKKQAVVISNIEINGKKAKFENGVLTQFPILIDANRVDLFSSFCHLNKESEIWLNIENNYDEKISLKLELPQENFITLKQSNISLELDSRERTTIYIPYILNDFGFYNKYVNLIVETKSGKTIEFHRRIGIPFNGINSQLFGEMDKKYMLYSGINHICYYKDYCNDVGFFHNNRSSDIFMFSPCIGMPFSSEFDLIKPSSCEQFKTKDGGIGMKIELKSRDFKGFIVYSYRVLYQNGLACSYYEILNTNNFESASDIHIKNKFTFEWGIYNKPTIPLRNGIVSCNSPINNRISFWNNKDIVENWIFFESKHYKSGFCWEGGQFIIADWYLSIEDNLGKIPANGSKFSSKFWSFVNTFDDYNQFREFALDKQVEKELPRDEFEIIVNDENPFLINNENSLEVIVLSNKSNMPLNGEVQISSDKNIFEPKVSVLSKEDEIREASFNIGIDDFNEIDLIKGVASYSAFDISAKTLIFKGNGDVKTETITENGLNAFKVDNGLITIKVAPEYSNRIYSMSYKGNEWLDTAFPKYVQKSWFNPFIGGIGSRIAEMSQKSLLKEKSLGEFVTRVDSKGNVWTGVKTGYILKEFEKLKGVEWYDYYLMLPKVPVVAYFTEIVNGAKHHIYEDLFLEFFFNPYNDLSNCWYSFDEKRNMHSKIRMSDTKKEFEGDNLFRIGNKNKEDILSILLNSKAIGLSEINNFSSDVLATFFDYNLNIRNMDKVNTKALFFVFHKENYDTSSFNCLHRIIFK